MASSRVSVTTGVWLGAAFTLGALAVPGTEPSGGPGSVTGAAPAAPTATLSASPTPTPPDPYADAGATATPATPDGSPWITSALGVRNTSLGDVVTDDRGRVVYTSDADATDPPRSNCYGQCARRWPPVYGDGRLLLLDERIPASAVGTVQRRDGTLQVTLGRWPLYTFVGDTAAGQVRGHNPAKAVARRPGDGQAGAVTRRAWMD